MSKYSRFKKTDPKLYKIEYDESIKMIGNQSIENIEYEIKNSIENKVVKLFGIFILSILVSELILGTVVKVSASGFLAFFYVLILALAITFFSYCVFECVKKVQIRNENVNNQSNIFNQVDEFIGIEVDFESEIYKISKIISINPELFYKYIVVLKEKTCKDIYDETTALEKIVEYINDLSFEDEEKMILLKVLLPKINKFDKKIVKYISKREDISYEDTLFVLEELGFAVFSDGTVKW